MILTCPACNTRYQVDENGFSPAGRNVRCAKCGYVWHQPPPVYEGQPEPVYAAPEPPPPRAYEAPPRRQSYMPPPSFEVEPQERAPRARSRWPGRLFLGMGWIALAAIVVLVGWTAAVYRQQVVARWPQSASLYSTLGLKTHTKGLQIIDYRYHEEIKSGQPTLVVTGKLVNIGGRELSVPQIRATLSDDGKRELYHWTFMPSVISLRPGQTTRFVTRLPSPPAAARNLELRFARAGE
jgi:predicted Zn finger-like uncharacterized protein